MSFDIIPTPDFAKELKRLSKKYPSLKADIRNFLSQLEKDPYSGKALGNNCYKIRLSVSSKGKGKSGGARVITHVLVMFQKLYLLSIYDKSETGAIADKEIISRIKNL